MRQAFDYIVVGAGSAGCAIAARLSEDRGVSVLLIEAGGPDRHPFFKIPLAWLRATTLSRHLWSYRSEPEPTLNGRQFPFVRGKVLGGTSTINGMIYARGHRRDYDKWAEQGLPQWRYADVLPWFRRLESSWRGASHLHGDHGPVGTSRPHVPGMHFDDWAAAAKTISIDVLDDLADGAGEGLSPMELTVANGKRVSSASAYLTDARSRPNLAIRMNVQVDRIQIAKGRATGVRCRINGDAVEFHASREVIVSAGTYGSPHLLMLSGIGPADHLRDWGIRVHADLPAVGQHLKEHVILPVGFRANHDQTFLRELRADRVMANGIRWLLKGEGALATNGVGANLYLRSIPDLDCPDVRLICGTIGPTANIWLPFGPSRPKHEYMCVVNLLHPKSEGTVSLRSAVSTEPPRIQFNLLREKADRDTLIRGIRSARALLSAPALARHVGTEWTPGAPIQDDEALDMHIRSMAAIGQHPVGTCRMGVGRDAVVDGHLKVHGLDGLRVADASIFPDQIGGNPSIPVMMIAERVANFIQNGDTSDQPTRE